MTGLGLGYCCIRLVLCLLQCTGPYSNALHKTSVWGPTCDGLDKICETLMPELNVGDWIYFDNMGAYTISSSSSFNGFAKPVSYYYIREINRCVPCVENVFLLLISKVTMNNAN